MPGLLNQPFGVDFDAGGNMYIVELAGGRVHKLDGCGGLTTVAGDGSRSYPGDGGSARAATFNGMHSIAALPDGSLFIADSWNHCVRRIDGMTGTIRTIAGTGEAGFSGDGGPATKATFDYVMRAALDPARDALYVADLKNLRIRRIDLASGIVTTIAGNGQKGVPADGSLAVESPLVDPRSVAVTDDGVVYVLERAGHALRVVTPDGRIRTVAGTGAEGIGAGRALHSAMRFPKDLAIDSEGRVYIADDRNHRVCRFDPATGMIEAVLGTGVESPRITLNRPHGLAIAPDGSLYVVDSWNHRILRLLL